MRISKLRLTDFKRHEGLEIEPAAGLTIVRGPNEAGKTTVQTALELGLFRKADSMARDVQALQRWGASAAPVVEIDFEAEESEGHLSKRFAGQRAEAELSYGGQSTRDNAQIAEIIGDLTGIPTESFFRATASVGHAELAAVAGDEPIIQDRLQKAISGADRGTAAAKKKLSAAVHRYRTEGHKNPGLLKVGRAEIETLEGELSAGEEALVRLETDRAQWVEARERRELLDKQLTRQQADLAEARRAEQLVNERDAARQSYERLRRGAELVSQENELRRTSPTELPLATIRTGVSRASNLSFDLSELEAELSVDATEASEEGGPDYRRRAWRWLAVGVVLTLLAGAAYLVLSDIVGVIALLVLGVLAIVALVLTVRSATRARRNALALELAHQAAVERQERSRDREEEFRRKRRDLELELTTLGVSSVEEGEQLLAAAEKHTEQLARIDGELKGLGIEERNARRLEADRDQAAAAAERAGHALAGMGTLADDPATTRQALQRSVEQTLPARDEARSQEDQALGRVDANQVDAESVAAVAERLEQAREQQTLMERRARVYEETLAMIEEAERATLKTAARYLEERMGPAIERITGGRYREIEVDERNLAFRVRAPENGAFVDVAELSHGTADQLYLTARLGLIRLVTMDRRPPVLLDDPFVTFDAVRGERALRLVKDVAAEQGFQVLYLTCSDRFDGLADELIVLEGPRVDQDGSEVGEPSGPPAMPAASTNDGSAAALATEVPTSPDEPDAAGSDGGSEAED